MLSNVTSRPPRCQRSFRCCPTSNEGRQKGGGSRQSHRHQVSTSTETVWCRHSTFAGLWRVPASSRESPHTHCRSLSPTAWPSDDLWGTPQICRFMCSARWSDREKHLRQRRKKHKKIIQTGWLEAWTKEGSGGMEEEGMGKDICYVAQPKGCH